MQDRERLDDLQTLQHAQGDLLKLRRPQFQNHKPLPKKLKARAERALPSEKQDFLEIKVFYNNKKMTTFCFTR